MFLPEMKESNPSPSSTSGSESVRRGVLANFSWLSAGLAASRLLQLAVIVYLARVLGDAAFGRFSFVQAFLWFGVIVSDFGLSQIATRELARSPRRLRTLSSIVLFGRLAVFLAEMLLIVGLLPILHTGWQLFWLFVFSFASLLPYAINTEWVFRGYERMEYVALWEVLPRVIWLGGSVLFVHTPDDLLRVPLLRLAGELVTTGLLLAVAWRGYPNSRPSLSLLHPLNIKILVKEAAPVGMAALLAQVYYNFDTILLKAFKSDALVGQYSAAYRLVTLLMTGTFLLAATYQPVLARCYGSDRPAFARHLRRLISTSFLFGITLPAVVAIGAVPIIRVLYGQTFAPAALPLAILMASMPFAYLATACTTALVAAGLQKQMMVATAIGAGCNIAANLVLIPTQGMTGAAIATVLSYAIACAVQWWYLGRLNSTAR